MEEEENIDDSHSILIREGSDLPECVAEWVLKESSNVLEGSPFLCHISWLSSFSDELSVITISLLSKSSINY